MGWLCLTHVVTGAIPLSVYMNEVVYLRKLDADPRATRYSHRIQIVTLSLKGTEGSPEVTVLITHMHTPPEHPSLAMDHRMHILMLWILMSLLCTALRLTLIPVTLSYFYLSNQILNRTCKWRPITVQAIFIISKQKGLEINIYNIDIIVVKLINHNYSIIWWSHFSLVSKSHY